MPILGSRLFDELDTERICCITGHLSGGKTRLAFDIAHRYWRVGYRVESNISHNYAPLSGYRERLYSYRTVNVIDEGGEFVRKAALASTITRSAGKADYYVIFSGKRLPHKELQSMLIRPRFDFFVNYGIPLLLWKAEIYASIKYHFPFFQVLPQLLHGTYSTLSSAGSVDKFLVSANKTLVHLAERDGDIAGIQAEAGLLGLADDIASAVGVDIS